MTKPRQEIQRELFGVLGNYPKASQEIALWNKSFAEHGKNAWMSKYAASVKTLPERLSEMFHFDRRGYIVAPELEEAILPYLDHVEDHAQKERRVNTVLNERGVLTGARCTDEERKQKWLSS